MRQNRSLLLSLASRWVKLGQQLDSVLKSHLSSRFTGSRKEYFNGTVNRIRSRLRIRNLSGLILLPAGELSILSFSINQFAQKLLLRVDWMISSTVLPVISLLLIN